MAFSVAGRRDKLSEAAHLAHPIHAPLSDATVAELIEAMQFRPGYRGVLGFVTAVLLATASWARDPRRAAIQGGQDRVRIARHGDELAALPTCQDSISGPGELSLANS